jgi:replicative DNA helicase
MKSKTEIVESLRENISSRTSRPKIPTGIYSLDDLTWGVHKKELLVIGARPSHGKTSLSLNMAWGIAKQDISTIFLSLEMSRESIYERLMCIEFGLHAWKLRTGDTEEIKKSIDIMDKFTSRLLTTPIEVFEDKGKTIASVEEVLKEMAPSVLFIDYAQKISSKGYGGKYEALSDYVVRLQSLAIQYDCAIVLNSQINRGGSKVDNATDFMKGSGEIEESADCLLQCDWLYRSDPTRLDTKEFMVKAVKQRHGPCSYVALDFDAATFRFSDRESEVKDYNKA